MSTTQHPEALAEDHSEQNLEMVARWYMVNKDGMATLCTDKADAEKEAEDAQSVWPHMGPHRAVQLVEAADIEALRAGYDAARLEIESLRARGVASAGEYLLPGRTTDELTESQRESAIAAYRAAHGHDPDFGFAPDRAWIEGAAYVDADRAMRVAQPAGAQQPGACGNTPYDEGPFTLEQRSVTAGVTGPRDVVSIQRQAFIRGWDERGMAHQLKGTVETDERMRVLMDIYFPRTAAPTTQPAPQQEPSHTAVQLAELVLSDCGHSSNYTPLLDRVAARIDSHVERRLDELRGCLESKPAPQQEAQEPVAWYVTGRRPPPSSPPRRSPWRASR